MKITKLFFFFLFLIVLGLGVYFLRNHLENRHLAKIIERLTASSRVAQVIVTDTSFNQETSKTYTTIKFLEYDTHLGPLKPKYFTFSGNIIQFQSMVIRFDDFYVKKNHPLKGKSAYLFTKAFHLTQNGAEIFDITKINEVPAGYQVDKKTNNFEKQLWRKFWQYALDSKEAKRMGIKSAQLEAPGTKFIPGLIYTLKIDHSGGLRINAQPIAPVLQGEKIKF